MSVFYTALILASSVVFVLSSLTHGSANSYSKSKTSARHGLLWFHYLAELQFLLATTILSTIFGIGQFFDFAALLLMVVVIHAIRYYVDRLVEMDHNISPQFIRPIADALANFGTAIFVLAAVRTNNVALMFTAVFFSLMIILKELKFRFYDELTKRADGGVSTSQGGVELLGKSNQIRNTSNMQYGRTLKSIFYTILGFALLYLSLDSIWPSLNFLSGNSLVQALSVSLLAGFRFISTEVVGQGQDVPTAKGVVGILEYLVLFFLIRQVSGIRPR